MPGGEPEEAELPPGWYFVTDPETGTRMLFDAWGELVEPGRAQFLVSVTDCFTTQILPSSIRIDAARIMGLGVVPVLFTLSSL